MRQTKNQIAILAVLVLGFTGCEQFRGTVAGSGSATPPPQVEVGSDPIVVNAEKTLLIGRDTFLLLSQVEYTNREELAKIVPAMRGYADYIRRNSTRWLKTANSLKNAYKYNRTSENQRALVATLATISEAINQSKQYLGQAGVKAP
jgi:hypothetical protein